MLELADGGPTPRGWLPRALLPLSQCQISCVMSEGTRNCVFMQRCSSWD